MRKNKEYIVTITTKKHRDKVNVLATSKKEAIQITNNVLVGCDCFYFYVKDGFKLKARRKRWWEK